MIHNLQYIYSVCFCLLFALCANVFEKCFLNYYSVLTCIRIYTYIYMRYFWNVFKTVFVRPGADLECRFLTRESYPFFSVSCLFSFISYSQVYILAFGDYLALVPSEAFCLTVSAFFVLLCIFCILTLWYYVFLLLYLYIFVYIYIYFLIYMYILNYKLFLLFICNDLINIFTNWIVWLEYLISETCAR